MSAKLIIFLWVIAKNLKRLPLILGTKKSIVWIKASWSSSGVKSLSVRLYHDLKKVFNASSVSSWSTMVFPWSPGGWSTPSRVQNLSAISWPFCLALRQSVDWHPFIYCCALFSPVVILWPFCLALSQSVDWHTLFYWCTLYILSPWNSPVVIL